MTKKPKDNLYFKTADLALVALLRLYNYQIISTERLERQIIFCIMRDKKIEKIISDFRSHRLKIDPLLYFNSLKETKSYIYKY